MRDLFELRWLVASGLRTLLTRVCTAGGQSHLLRHQEVAASLTSRQSQCSWARVGSMMTGIALAVAVSGCGGGGGGDAPAAPPIAGTSTMVSVDPALPIQVTSSISQVVSPLGIGHVGDRLPYDAATSSGQSIAFGVNNAGKLLVAALFDSGTTTLDADTTATALVQLLLGSTHTTMTGAQVSLQIRQSPDYLVLVSLIESALRAGSSPLDDPATVQQVVKVALGAIETISTQASKERPLAIQPPPVGAAGTYPLIPPPPQLQSPVRLSVYEGQSGGSIFNDSPIKYLASAHVPGGAGVPVTLDPGKFTDLPMRTGPFDLTIKPNVADIADAIFDGMVDVVFKYVPDKPCGASTLSTVLKGQLKDLNTLSPTPPTLSSFLASIRNTVTVENVTDVLSTCAVDFLKNNIGFTLFYTYYIGSYVTLLEAVPGAAAVVGVINAAPLLSVINYSNYYWDKEKTTGVCGTSSLVIAKCAASFVFTPESLLLAPGAVTLVALEARDASQASTLTPGGLLYESTNDSVVAVSGTGSPTVVAPKSLAISPSVATINVTEPINLATGTLPVSVVWPKLAPSQEAFNATVSSQTLTVSLTGPNGEPIILPSGTIEWSTTSGAATIRPVTVTGTMSTWSIPPNAVPGDVKITAKDPFGNNYPVLVVHVLPPASTGLEVFKVVRVCSVTPGTGETIIWDTYNNPYQPVLGAKSPASGSICAAAHDLYHPITLCKKDGVWMPKTETWKWVPISGNVTNTIEVNIGSIQWTVDDQGNVSAESINHYDWYFVNKTGQKYAHKYNDSASVVFNLSTGAIHGANYHFDDDTITPLANLWRVSRETTIELSQANGLSTQLTRTTYPNGTPVPLDCGTTSHESPNGSFP